jgi:hypothetical protein
VLVRSADTTALDAERNASASKPALPAPLAAIPERARTDAWYALAVLTLASIVSFADRQNLGRRAAQLGSVLGSAFAVFYYVVGIAMRRSKPSALTGSSTTALLSVFVRLESYAEAKYSDSYATRESPC